MRFTFALPLVAVLFGSTLAAPSCNYSQSGKNECIKHFKSEFNTCERRYIAKGAIKEYCNNDKCAAVFNECVSNIPLYKRDGYYKCEQGIKDAISKAYNKDWSYIEENELCIGDDY